MLNTSTLKKHLIYTMLGMVTGILISAAATAAPTNNFRPNVKESNHSSKEFEDAQALRNKMASTVREWYPRLRGMLWTPEKLPTDDTLVLEYRENPAKGTVFAYAVKPNKIIIYDRYTETGDKATGGLIIHEMVHLLQNSYRNDRASWMSEALADYFRYAVFDAISFEKFLKITRESLKIPKNSPIHGYYSDEHLEDSLPLAKLPIEHVDISEKFRRMECPDCRAESYTGFLERGYQYYHDPVHAAGMLVMIEHYYYPGFVYQLHRKLFESVQQNQPFTNVELSALLMNLTNKTLDELWCEYMARVNKTSISRCEVKRGWLFW